MNHDTTSIKAVDHIQDGIAITFTDDMCVFFSATYLLARREDPEVTRLLPAEEGY